MSRVFSIAQGMGREKRTALCGTGGRVEVRVVHLNFFELFCRDERARAWKFVIHDRHAAFSYSQLSNCQLRSGQGKTEGRGECGRSNSCTVLLSALRPRKPV